MRRHQLEPRDRSWIGCRSHRIGPGCRHLEILLWRRGQYLGIGDDDAAGREEREEAVKATNLPHPKGILAVVGG